MPLVLANRVQESATANTTVSFTLTGAVSGFQTFAVVGDTNTTYYSATDSSGNWEVGLGTYSTTGPTLTRTTVYASSNSGNAVTFSGAVNVFVTYPSGRSVNLDSSGNVSALGTVASGTWQGSTVGVAYGGTGVTSSSGANSVVLRDADQNITANRVNQSNANTTAAGGTTALTTASSYIQSLVGTGGQTYALPDATTLTTGVAFIFNNLATGTLTITDYATATIGTIASGGAGAVFLTNNATVGGTWDLHAYLPEGVTFGTNAFNLGSAVISGGTWQGGTIQPGYGGTGLTTFTGANNALYSTGATTLTAGTLPVVAGGTGATTASGALTSLGAVAKAGDTMTGELTLAASTTANASLNIPAGTAPTSPVSGDLWFDSSSSNLVFRQNAATRYIALSTSATTSTSPTFTNLSAASLSVTSSIIASGLTSMSVTATTGTITIGGNNATGTLTLGSSTNSQTTNIQAGATSSGNTKTINFGTGGLSGSTTTMAIGSTFGTTVTANGTWNYTGAVTSTNTAGFLTRAAATQDGIELVGRAGGSSSYKVSQTPTTLTANRTVTWPDANVDFTTGVAVANGGTGRATATAYAVLCGGTTSTGAHQSIASVGTSGQVLTSNGAGALPTFQAAAGVFAAGTAMLFVQTAAPTGWTKSTTHDNKALRVVTGTASSGGTTGFSTVFANQTPTISNTFSISSTTLTTSQIPSHTHNVGNTLFNVQPACGGVNVREAGSANTASGSTGGGGSHTHTLSGSATSSAITLNVQYVDVIIATKD